MAFPAWHFPHGVSCMAYFCTCCGHCLIETAHYSLAHARRGQTPLHFASAARERAMEACKALMDAGAATDTMDGMGRVPYECADSDDVRQLLGGPDSR